MEKISKPHIVEFLRLCDRNHWLHPRIRYASIRSKPQLLADVKRHFRSRRRGSLLLFHPLRRLPTVPKISYDFERKRFLYDGKPIALPIRSQEQTRFHIERGPVVVAFPRVTGSPPAAKAGSATRRGAGLFERSRTPSTGCSLPSPPSLSSGRTPSLEPSDPLALGTRTPEGSPTNDGFSYLSRCSSPPPSSPRY